MKLISIWVIIIVFGNYAIGGDAYKLIDIKECVLPISKKLEQIEFGNYTEKDYNGSLYINPISVAISKIDNDTPRIASKAKKILHLNKAITILGFKVFTNNKEVNHINFIYLQEHTLLVSNYPLNDLKYMLSYCKKTSN